MVRILFLITVLFSTLSCATEVVIVPIEKVTDSGKNFSIEDLKKNRLETKL